MLQKVFCVVDRYGARVRCYRAGPRGPTDQTEIGPAAVVSRLQLGAYNGMIQHDEEIRFYYSGMKHRVPQHSAWLDGTPRDPSTLSESERADWLQDTTSAMYLARLRRDGFVSLDAGKDGGELVTKPLLVEADRLRLNLAVHDGGHARVEVLDENSKPVPGFGRDDSDPLQGDAIDQIVARKWGADVKELAGKPIRLRIHLTDADLYSFQFTSKN